MQPLLDLSVIEHPQMLLLVHHVQCESGRVGLKMGI